ncbi:MAG: hypothetical protein HYY20_12220 [Candidatus Tectomicrobia bacterium]|uniref:Uncharacterized protein n=1 Tax=Tectimicrobiota bacterium TaxID=2528274 RepID=A0A932CQX0_UNCTE|nr:hypothetical protein [Candidatus Tectomicrobia bacterium]
MSSSIFGVGHLFRLYGQQIRGERKAPPLDRPSPAPSDAADVVQISQSGRKLQIFRQISSQLVENLTSSEGKREEQIAGVRKDKEEKGYPKPGSET